ncbi:hypothetical protein PMKS-002854 [Pichia membranifaciens]|uniref:Endoplasmic oxidoreductin-1 n=1 Tax=Pichia membranifaciens TaxID=4926 RepID=A0A1Q2YIJ6_9ASCO|nr:hypothetical protein PMKS-002854 [Pichia membranifaciens]
MKLSKVFSTLTVVYGLCLGVCTGLVGFDFNDIEDDIVVRYEKKPPHHVEFSNYHQFLKTPFKNETYENFLQSYIDESTAVTFQDVNDLNDKIRPVIKHLVTENFFRIFRLNLFKECPFWKGDGFCMHRSCAVDTIDDWEKLPDIWQPEALGKLEDSVLVKKLNADAEYSSKDYCDLDGFIHDTVFVDLVANPERFTGYGGDQSWQIWKSIYNENCFNLGHDQCVEKNFFYKIVSGMHASISTHLSNEYLDTTAMDYKPSLVQFMMRVGNYPDRMANLYLNYIVVLKALIKLETFGIFDDLTFCEDLNFVEKENEFKTRFKELLDPALEFSECQNECLFDENILFKEKNSASVKDEIKQNFKNITRIMDCVHCDRCRLWGKLQTTGYGTALKVLFELTDKESFQLDLSKIELIALVNTFDRLSKSIESINNFKAKYDEAIRKEEMGEDGGDDGFGNDTLGNLNDSAFVAKSKQKDPKNGPTKGILEDSENNYKTPDLFQKETEMYEDVIYPNIGLDDTYGETLGQIFKLELRNVFNTLKFVIRSYYLFPKLVYNWCLIRVVYYWNTFVGHVNEDFDFDRLYRIEI